jgi:hypothetical protein
MATDCTVTHAAMDELERLNKALFRPGLTIDQRCMAQVKLLNHIVNHPTLIPVAVHEWRKSRA